jgi:endonuclease/exonuclease/phosphatase family metal-dependent hydrolase
MKNFTLVSILILLVNSHVMIAQQKYMSFNIRFDNPADGEDRWEVRKEELSNMIQKYEPDFLGIQEALPNQVEYLDSQLQNYKYIGFGRDGEGSQSESVPIFYKADRHELLKKEVFWLSETPENPSKGWDAALNRITTYGIFLNRQTRDTLHVFNTHYDHRGEKARVNSSRLLVSKIESMRLRDKKVILMGDFNSRPEEEPVKILNKAFADACINSEKEPRGPYGTFNGFDPEAELDQRIDYVFLLNFKVLSYTAVDDKRKNGRWISDHLPVLVEVFD